MTVEPQITVNGSKPAFLSGTRLLMRLLVGFLMITVLAGTGCGSQGETQVMDPVVVAEAPSSDSMLTAVVLRRGEEHRFGIRSRNGTLSIVDRDFVPQGYHEPIVKLKWDEADAKVSVSVDHDFGEGILTFIYDTRNFSWTQQP